MFPTSLQICHNWSWLPVAFRRLAVSNHALLGYYWSFLAFYVLIKKNYKNHFMCIEIMYNSKCGFEAKFTIKLFYFLFFFKCSAQVRTAHQSEMKALFYIYSPRFMFLPSLVLLHSPHPQTNPHPKPRLLWAALIPDSASKSQGGEKKKKSRKLSTWIWNQPHTRRLDESRWDPF